jgi:Flp pilus assembly protein TadG
MRRLAMDVHDERGASAVMVAVLMIPILGFMAIALDVGALYAERAQLQNGADSAALAIAQDCANGACGTSAARAAELANDNANDAAANVLTPVFPTGHSVKVTSSTREAGSGAGAISHPFARFIGTDSTTVSATATAEWGSPGAGATTLPIAISYCEFRPSLDGTLQLIRYDQQLQCAGRDGHPIPGGFGWLERIPGECGSYIDLDDATMPSEPGNSYPGTCDATMSTIKGDTILVPIFDGASVKSGPATSYHIYAFAAFTITGWKLSGGTKKPEVDLDPAAPACTGNCRGIQGYFDHWVSIEAAGAELGGPDLGASIVRLIK